MKKLLILLSLSALVFGCDKHNDDYKNNIPEWKEHEPEPEPEKEYTLEDLNNLISLADFRHVTRFIGGYITVESVNIHGVLLESSEWVVKFKYGGKYAFPGYLAIPGGDPEFNRLADEYGEEYGPYDVVRNEFVVNSMIAICNNIKYHIYDLNGNYVPGHDAGSSLDDIVKYNYSEREYRKPLIGFEPWTETSIVVKKELLEEYNQKELTLLGRDDSALVIPLPEEAGTYSFRIVAQSGDEILCDQTIEDIKLPARKK